MFSVVIKPILSFPAIILHPKPSDPGELVHPKPLQRRTPHISAPPPFPLSPTTNPPPPSLGTLTSTILRTLYPEDIRPSYRSPFPLPFPPHKNTPIPTSAAVRNSPPDPSLPLPSLGSSRSGTPSAAAATVAGGEERERGRWWGPTSPPSPSYDHIPASATLPPVRATVFIGRVIELEKKKKGMEQVVRGRIVTTTTTTNHFLRIIDL